LSTLLDFDVFISRDGLLKMQNVFSKAQFPLHYAVFSAKSIDFRGLHP